MRMSSHMIFDVILRKKPAPAYHARVLGHAGVLPHDTPEIGFIFAVRSPWFWVTKSQNDEFKAVFIARIHAC